MRELTNEELFLVAGAAAAADVDPSEPPTEIPPIVVNPPRVRLRLFPLHRQLSSQDRSVLQVGAALLRQ
ncbi:hydroxyproline-rich glycoprotein DZ-HRGP [Xanthomonas fragariae]|nr:hydroxyproline-rich glycoprotein DZ-HRGP [Xanthomonas fragariae]